MPSPPRHHVSRAHRAAVGACDATDGVTDGLWDRQIAELVREAGEGDAAPALVRAAVENSGRDNCTALVVELA